jgi:hypothetical protein
VNGPAIERHVMLPAALHQLQPRVRLDIDIANSADGDPGP